MARSNRTCLGVCLALGIASSLLAPFAYAEIPVPVGSGDRTGSGNGSGSRDGADEGKGRDAKPPVGMFIDLEWRIFGIGAHVSHGPAFAAGVSLLDGHLRIGFGGLARPGPFNPDTFDVVLDDGTTYKGQSTVSLRNDGMMGGLHLGYSTALPFARAFALQVPVTLGYGGFGYYLNGDDRDTPDGRRVSEWEDELFDNQDAYIGFVFDAGVRVRYQAPDFPWLMPYVGAAFTMVPGFTTVVRDDYLGVSGLIGVELGIGQ